MTISDFVYSEILRPKSLKALANAVLRTLIPREVSIYGATVVLNPTDPVVSGALTLRVYEKGETRFFRRVYHPGMTFLDIGANVGYYTALALRMSDGEGRIVALEPDPNSFEYLEQTVKRNGGLNTTCVPKAAGVRRDRLPLYLSKDNRGDNRLYEHEFQTETCLVEVAPVDELLDELGIDTVDLIKIDVQGYEGHVVRGMASAIRHSDQLVIMMEFWPDGLRRAGSDPLGLLRTLREWGLTLFMLTPGGSLIPVPDDQTLIERFPGRRYTNLVAVKGMDRAY